MTESKNFRRLLGLLQESGWIAAGQVLALIGFFFLIRLLTESLSPNQYGELALCLTIAGLLNQVVMGGLIASVGRFYSVAKEKGELPAFFVATKHLTTHTGITVAFITLALIGLMRALDISNASSFALPIFVYAVFSGFSAILIGIKNAARMRKLVAINSALDPWLKILVSILFIYSFGFSTLSVLSGYAFASCLLAIGQWVLFDRHFPDSQARHSNSATEWVREMKKFAWPFSFWGIFTWSQQASDRWALQQFVGHEAVGMYSVLFQLGYVPIGMLMTVFITLIGPVLYTRIGGADDYYRVKGTHSLAWLYASACLCLTLCATAIGAVLHRFIFALCTAPSYHEYSHMLPWVVLAGGLFSTGQVLALKLLSEMRPAALMLPKILTAILGVILNFVGASSYGTIGVVSSLVCFSLVYFIWMAWLARNASTVAA